jgi:hypothetical protein
MKSNFEKKKEGKMIVNIRLFPFSIANKKCGGSCKTQNNGMFMDGFKDDFKVWRKFEPLTE